MIKLRESKKIETRNRILETAKDQFVKYGYDEVTMEQIALEAQVGTGTIYNYYKNKSDIFIAAIQSSILNEEEQEAIRNHIRKDRPAADIVIDALEQHMSRIQWFFSKKLARELLSAMAGFARKKNSIFDKLLEEDLKLIEKLKELIEDIMAEGIIAGDNDPEALSELVYSAFMFEYLMYLYVEETSKDELGKRVNRKIRAIFKGK